MSNLFKRETLSGEFLQINRYLVRDLQERGLWTRRCRDAIKRAEGSVQDIDAVPADLQALYRTAWELPMRSLIDMAADRGRVHRPEPVAEPVHGVADDRQAVVDVPARVEGGAQDHLLPALAAGDPHHQDDRGERG